MARIFGLVLAGGLVLGMTSESKAQFMLSVGNPYGYGGYGGTYVGMGGYGMGGYGYPGFAYSSGYMGIAPYGVGGVGLPAYGVVNRGFVSRPVYGGFRPGWGWGGGFRPGWGWGGRRWRRW